MVCMHDRNKVVHDYMENLTEFSLVKFVLKLLLCYVSERTIVTCDTASEIMYCYKVKETTARGFMLLSTTRQSNLM